MIKHKDLKRLFSVIAKKMSCPTLHILIAKYYYLNLKLGFLCCVILFFRAPQVFSQKQNKDVDIFNKSNTVNLSIDRSAGILEETFQGSYSYKGVLSKKTNSGFIFQITDIGTANSRKIYPEQFVRSFIFEFEIRKNGELSVKNDLIELTRQLREENIKKHGGDTIDFGMFPVNINDPQVFFNLLFTPYIQMITPCMGTNLKDTLEKVKINVLSDTTIISQSSTLSLRNDSLFYLSNAATDSLESINYIFQWRAKKDPYYSQMLSPKDITYVPTKKNSSIVGVKNNSSNGFIIKEVKSTTIYNYENIGMPRTIGKDIIKIHFD